MVTSRGIVGAGPGPPDAASTPAPPRAPTPGPAAGAGPVPAPTRGAAAGPAPGAPREVAVLGLEVLEVDPGPDLSLKAKDDPTPSLGPSLKKSRGPNPGR